MNATPKIIAAMAFATISNAAMAIRQIDVDPEVDNHPAGYGTFMVVFLALLWAMLDKKGPLREFAENHGALAFIGLFFVPYVASLFSSW